MTQIQTSRAFIKAREAWLVELRSACLVLSEKPKGVVGAISVTQRFVELDATERELLVSLATNLAGEYGLSATVIDSGAWLTARVAHTTDSTEPDARLPRHDEPDLAPGPARRGFFAKLIGLLPGNYGNRELEPVAHPAGVIPALIDKALEAATTAESLEIS